MKTTRNPGKSSKSTKSRKKEKPECDCHCHDDCPASKPTPYKSAGIACLCYPIRCNHCQSPQQEPSEDACKNCGREHATLICPKQDNLPCFCHYPDKNCLEEKAEPHMPPLYGTPSEIKVYKKYLKSAERTPTPKEWSEEFDKKWNEGDFDTMNGKSFSPAKIKVFIAQLLEEPTKEGVLQGVKYRDWAEGVDKRIDQATQAARREVLEELEEIISPIYIGKHKDGGWMFSAKSFNKLKKKTL